MDIDYNTEIHEIRDHVDVVTELDSATIRKVLLAILDILSTLQSEVDDMNLDRGH